MRIYKRKSDDMFPCYQDMVDAQGAKNFDEVIDQTQVYDPTVSHAGKWIPPYENDEGVLVSYQAIIPYTEVQLQERLDRAWSDVRVKRDVELLAMDKLMQPWHPEHPSTDEGKEALATYMQTLRDLPASTENPEDVEFPQRPEFE